MLHSTVTKQAVISLSGNLVSCASDITDECDVRLERVEGRRKRRRRRGCHIVYQMQLCKCVMVAEDGERAGWVSGQTKRPCT